MEKKAHLIYTGWPPTGRAHHHHQHRTWKMTLSLLGMQRRPQLWSTVPLNLDLDTPRAQWLRQASFLPSGPVNQAKKGRGRRPPPSIGHGCCPPVCDKGSVWQAPRMRMRWGIAVTKWKLCFGMTCPNLRRKRKMRFRLRQEQQQRGELRSLLLQHFRQIQVLSRSGKIRFAITLSQTIFFYNSTIF